jgi:hypothetical protein
LVRPLSTASTAPPPPVSRHLCGRLLARASELGIAFLLHVPFSAHSRLKRHDIPLMFQRTPNLEPTIWRRGRLSRGEYKNTSSPLHFIQPGTLPTPSMGHLNSLNYISHQVGEEAKCHSVRSRACFPGFCVPNLNKTRKHTHWLPGASRGPHEFTSSRHRNSFTFISGIYVHTHSTA